MSEMLALLEPLKPRIAELAELAELARLADLPTKNNGSVKKVHTPANSANPDNLANPANPKTTQDSVFENLLKRVIKQLRWKEEEAAAWRSDYLEQPDLTIKTLKAVNLAVSTKSYPVLKKWMFR